MNETSREITALESVSQKAQYTREGVTGPAQVGPQCSYLLHRRAYQNPFHIVTLKKQ